MSFLSSLFGGSPKHKDLAEIISIESPDAARDSVEELQDLLEDQPKRKTQVKRAVVIAANRARAIMKKRNISQDERKEMFGVAGIYWAFARRLK